MAFLPQQETIVQYYADGITAIYTVPFFTPLEPDGTPNIDVYTQLSTATPIPESDIKLWGVDYTYTANLDPLTGGVITFLPGKIPPNGYVITIVRDVQASLDVEFSQAQTFSGFTLDAALDRLLLISQQNKTYALERNLSYIVNSYLPEDVIAANVQIPILSPGYIWIGATGGGVAAALLQESADTSTLRSELANEAPVTNGAALVGYYDSVNMNPTTVEDQLTQLTSGLVAAIPSGTIIDFGGTSAPPGFLLCDGTSYTTVAQPNLFAAIGYAWGGSGGNFNVPNLRGFVTAGAGGSLPPLSNTVGSAGGSATHTIVAAELPPHTHNVTYTYQTPQAANSGAVSGYSINAGTLQNHSNTVASANGPGTSDPMTIVQPTKIVLKCIKT